METNPIKKMAHNILRNRKQTFFDKHIMHPEREWFAGLLAGIIVLGVGISWSVSKYVQFNNISVTNESKEGADAIYRANLVDSALFDFEERKKSYEELKTQLFSKYQKTAEDVVTEADSLVGELASSTEETNIPLPVLEAEEGAVIEETVDEGEIRSE